MQTKKPRKKQPEPKYRSFFKKKSKGEDNKF